MGLNKGKVQRKLNYFGKSNWANEDTLHAVIDDFKIFNRGLSQAEIFDEI